MVKHEGGWILSCSCYRTRTPGEKDTHNIDMSTGTSVRRSTSEHTDLYCSIHMYKVRTGLYCTKRLRSLYVQYVLVHMYFTQHTYWLALRTYRCRTVKVSISTVGMYGRDYDYNMVPSWKLCIITPLHIFYTQYLRLKLVSGMNLVKIPPVA